ncbi:hypothetical protein BOO69_10595 [Sulfitobacter alexandrii]|uniref:Bacteriophage phiJL001 Gp84 C-terminal domain-containing protein n=1 Tax=Sulfitobacter alexandrii TaxID=1917485 RepID=A0A1J0WHM9_9RHOB|nr:DUF2163 domain-containing protein [Sulfitobacter alexandrii]APE43811.1 hypothetical protein BOO69_10595 [Sulfitobacter alexandrii]
MAGIDAALQEHLESGHTTLCHAWRITRSDGVTFAFTDHDLPLVMEGAEYRADTGLTARALVQTTGLSVDNTEALGALSDMSLREDEIEQGRFDGAEVVCWLVNWTDVAQRKVLFRGHIGEIRRAGGAFRAELRGLSETLNRSYGRVYQKPCTAVLGDGDCRFALDTPGYAEARPVQDVSDMRSFMWDGFQGFEAGWFTRGRLEVLDGPAQGLWGIVKHDRFDGPQRVVELWEPLHGPVGSGTLVRLVAGCDKRMETCRLKFDNIVNFQGFPDLPGEDWIVAVPRSTAPNTGGSLR